MAISKRVADNIDGGLWVDCGNGDLACVYVAYPTLETEIAYYLAFYHEGLPAHKTTRYDDLTSLCEAMRNVADLRRWKLAQ